MPPFPGGTQIEKQESGTGTQADAAPHIDPRANGAPHTKDDVHTPPVPSSQEGEASPRLYTPRTTHPLIELPDLDVDTGEVVIPSAEREELEAEAPMLAETVEEIAEDRAWLSHKLLNVRTIISFVLAIGIIVFLFTRLDIDVAATWATMLTASPLLLLAGFGIYYSAFWIRGARWKMLLENAGFQKKSIQLPSTVGLIEIIYLSWFVNCIVPAKLGDGYRSYLLKRNSGISFSSTMGTILAERMVDLLILFGLLVASFTLVGTQLSARRADFPLELVMLFGAGMVGVLIIGLVGLRFFSHHLMRFVPTRFKGKFDSFRQGILRSFKRRSLPVLLGYTVTIWLCEAARLFFVTRSLDAHAVTLSAVIFIALLSSLLTTLPLTPGGAGVVEGAVTIALGLFLDNHQLALSIAILDRLINYWSVIAGGLVLYLISRRR